MLFIMETINMYLCNLYCVRNCVYFCMYSICMHSSYVPLSGLGARLWGKCPCVSDSYFTKVTVWL